MADTKITGLLTPQVTTNPATDVLPIVNIADTSMASSGSTRKITVNQILGSGGTATLASATITGDLTVDTNTLKVDSANDRVGIGTASPAAFKLHVNGASGNQMVLSNGGEQFTLVEYRNGGTAKAQQYWDNTNTIFENYLSSGSHAFTWKASATEWMRLNATGLGVGGSPLDKFTVVGNSFLRGAAAGVRIGDGGGYGFISAYDQTLATPKDLVLQTGGGNVGVGVTPSAWQSPFKAIQLSGGSIAANSTGSLRLVQNAVFNSSAWLYIATAAASRYEQDSGGHYWFNAPSGTAGTAATFTTAMTLDASGNLLVGTTSNSPGGTQSQFVNQWSGSAKWGSTFNQTVSSATPYTHIAFCTNGTVRGSIDANNTTITYGTVSDYRLKENVQPISNALTRIAALKPSTYKWKDSGTDGEGFIAHELASVVPLAVIGQKDALNEDGTIKAQQIDLSKVVPILVAAIQELSAEVNALKNA